MKSKKLFYIIEPIDIDDDKIPDGFLASQYRIDKYGNKIFTKNQYITFSDLKSRINMKKGGITSDNLKPILNNNNKKVLEISKQQHNQFMNQQIMPGHLPPGLLINNGANYGHHVPNYAHNYGPNHGHYAHNYGPNHGHYAHNYGPNHGHNHDNQNTFMGNMTSGLGQGLGLGVGLGVGVAASDALLDGVASFF
jgi:hypothetical protein